MKLLVVALLVIGSISSLAQSPRQYLDEKENILAGPEGASYYRETTSKGNFYVVKDFYASNEQLAMEATCSGITPKLVYDGPYKTYHKNGALCEEGSYKDNDKRGLWKTFYENGQQEEEILYQEDSLQHEDDVEVNFKGIPEMNLLQQKRPAKDQFPFYGWATLSLDQNEQTRESGGSIQRSRD